MNMHNSVQGCHRVKKKFLIWNKTVSKPLSIIWYCSNPVHFYEENNLGVFSDEMSAIDVVLLFTVSWSIYKLNR